MCGAGLFCLHYLSCSFFGSTVAHFSHKRGEFTFIGLDVTSSRQVILRTMTKSMNVGFCLDKQGEFTFIGLDVTSSLQVLQVVCTMTNILDWMLLRVHSDVTTAYPVQY
jgi:hypothetical protein